MTDDRTLLSTDMLPVAAVTLPRELTPDGAPAPIDVDVPVRSTASTGRRLAYIAIGMTVAWLVLGLVVMPQLPGEWANIGALVGLATTGIGLFAFIAFDHDRLFMSRRRRGWMRAMADLDGEVTASGAHAHARIRFEGRTFAAELGIDDYGLWCFWLRAIPSDGESIAEITLRRRSVARRFWPTGDAPFDAVVAVHGPMTARTVVLDAESRAAWAELITDTDVSVDDGRLMFSLTYAPRTSLTRPIKRIIERLCRHAARCIYRPDDAAARLLELTGREPPAVAANALRALRAANPEADETRAARDALLSAADPWHRVLAAEVCGHEDTLVNALSSDAQAIRFRAIDALIELWPLDGMAARLDLLLDHPEGAIRGCALSALGRRSLPLEIERLEAAAHDPDPQVGLGLLDWLGTATGPHVEHALITLIAHPVPAVVHRAADRLGRVGSPDAEAVLIELTRNKIHRRPARNALLHLRQRYPKSLGGVVVGRRSRR